MASITAESPAASTELPGIRGTAHPGACEESPGAVVLSFPRLMASQSDLIDAIRDLLQTAYTATRSEAVARALVEAHALLDDLEVD